jgi:hypothetical protein
MSPFLVEISEHAATRLKQRVITRAQVRKCLASGTKKLDLNGRKTKIQKFGNKTLEVIYLDVSGGYLVITAYWKGKTK